VKIAYGEDDGLITAIDEESGAAGMGATKAEAKADLLRQIGWSANQITATEAASAQVVTGTTATRKVPSVDGAKTLGKFRKELMMRWRETPAQKRTQYHVALQNLLATPRLTEVVEHYPSDGGAIDCLRKIFVILHGLTGDARGFRDSVGTIDQYRRALLQIEQAIELMKGAGPLVSADNQPLNRATSARDLISQELQYAESFLKALPIRPEHVGTRGGASKPEGAKRGALIRALDKVVPDGIRDRYAFIRTLLASAGIVVTSQAVRTALKQG